MMKAKKNKKRIDSERCYEKSKSTKPRGQ